MHASTSTMIRRTRVEVDLAAIIGNAREVAALTGAQVFAVVKADGYGHGAVAVAQALERARAVAGFGVSLVEEGVALRDAGIASPVLVMGPSQHGGEDDMVASKLTPVIACAEDLAALADVARRRGPVEAHLKVDTGMGRLGVPLSRWGWFLDRIARFEALDIAALLTHLAESESLDATFTAEQGRRFREAVATARNRGVTPPLLHVCNSGGLLTRPELHHGMVRPGVALYGVVPRPDLRAIAPLRPVMRVVTQVLFVRDLPVGASVSYGRSFVTGRPSRIATLPVGYADGYPRILGNRGHVLVGGRRCPVVGVVCMDLCMVDVTDVPGVVRSGDEAVLLGDQGDGPAITADELATWAGTIPYEILCGFSERVPRRHVEEAA